DEVVTPEIFRSEYDNLFESNERWNAIETTNEPLYEWQEDSTYIQNPPFFEGLTPEIGEIKPLNNLKVLGYFGDSITTDHIRSEEHTSELQSRFDLVCRLLLEKKKKK